MDDFSILEKVADALSDSISQLEDDISTYELTINEPQTEDESIVASHDVRSRASNLDDLQWVLHVQHSANTYPSLCSQSDRENLTETLKRLEDQLAAIQEKHPFETFNIYKVTKEVREVQKEAAKKKAAKKEAAKNKTAEEEAIAREAT